MYGKPGGLYLGKGYVTPLRFRCVTHLCVL